ncbi:MAG: DUF3443 domain-containing protein [Burkholderiaceae bacterium]|nr:DUF3443 domain-containing protein [Burkholderiaceae bacterium]
MVSLRLSREFLAAKLCALLALIAILALTACGGGGGSGGNGGSTSTTGSQTATNNVQAIVVDAGPPVIPGGAINEPFVTITVCAPNNPGNCQTIDHVLVDTGSWGLRLISAVLTPALAAALPQTTDANGNAIVECTPFADGYSWGPVKSANLQISGETATALPMQVIGDANFSSIPASCSSQGQSSEDTVATFGANGVIGVGTFAQDCGLACVQNANLNVYYLCGASSCQSTALALAKQVQNPVTYFANDNNGVMISLPAVSASGAATVTGSLIFGVGTQTNNGLGSAGIYTISNSTGYFTVSYNGTSYPDSFIDSGSNGLFFNDSAITQCSDNSGFYCPTSTLSLSAVNQGMNGNSGTVSFAVGNEAAIPGSITASPLLAGINGDPASFDWGLPFFYGRNVYSVIEGKSIGGAVGPYFAY